MRFNVSTISDGAPEVRLSILMLSVDFTYNVVVKVIYILRSDLETSLQVDYVAIISFISRGE